MNRNLLVFSLLLVLLGIGAGFYFLSFIGLLLMIPTLLSPPRPPVRTGPSPTRPQQAPRRISPPPVPHHQQAPYPAETKADTKAEAGMSSAYPMTSSSPSTSSTPTYTGALFPSPILPALSQMPPVPQQAKEAAQQKQGERDELVEVGTILALLKLVLG